MSKGKSRKNELSGGSFVEVSGVVFLGQLSARSNHKRMHLSPLLFVRRARFPTLQAEREQTSSLSLSLHPLTSEEIWLLFLWALARFEGRKENAYLRRRRQEAAQNKNFVRGELSSPCARKTKTVHPLIAVLRFFFSFTPRRTLDAFGVLPFQNKRARSCICPIVPFCAPPWKMRFCVIPRRAYT
jgi:hypothetical protein